MKISDLDTPSLLIDQDILTENLRSMQEYANRHHIQLRPHTKTHKMPFIATMQQDIGAVGIAVAKVGEAEIMAAHGLHNIMIANEITGQKKLERVVKLMDSCTILYGADSVYQIQEAEMVFAKHEKTAEIVIEIEVGENRSGIIREADFEAILLEIKKSPHVVYKGIFGHDGNTYRATSIEHCRDISLNAQERLLYFTALAEKLGCKSEVVSYGSTPAALCGCEILHGITELRVGTYALMDSSQAHINGDFSKCSATVLATVMSCPTSDRVILDVGAKGLTMQERKEGICCSGGKGHILGYQDTVIDSMFDEHAIIHSETFQSAVKTGDKVRIIPAHICPVVNLYDSAVFHSGEEVIGEIPVLCRGKLQ